MDLDTYLRRFDAYTQSIGAAPEDVPHLLINSLDDETLQYIERHLVDNITLPELLAVLRREMGISRLNREDYKAKLKKTFRGRNEDVRSFYSKLWNVAKRAWPDNAEVRESNLRDAFVGNFQDSAISARLRERLDLNNEQLLDLAVTLLNCKNASLSRQSEVNAAFGLASPFDQAMDVETPARSLPSQALEQKLDQVITMLAANVSTPPTNAPSQNAQPHHNANSYQYTGDRRSVGLNNYNRGYSGPRNFNNYNPRGFNPRYSTPGPRPTYFYNGHRGQFRNQYRPPMSANRSWRGSGSWNRPQNYFPRGRNF